MPMGSLPSHVVLIVFVEVVSQYEVYSVTRFLTLERLGATTETVLFFLHMNGCCFL